MQLPEGYKRIDCGDWEILHTDFVDNAKMGTQYEKLINMKNEAKDEKPFVWSTDILLGESGFKKGAYWYSCKPNVTCAVIVPCSIFKSKMHENFFPSIVMTSIVETMNNFSDEDHPFVFKFFNDIVCREHYAKCVGQVARRYNGWVYNCFGVDISEVPPPEAIREKGLKPCCIFNHIKDPKKKNFDKFDFLKACVTPIIKTAKENYNIKDLLRRSVYYYQLNHRACREKGSVRFNELCNENPTKIFKESLFDKDAYLEWLKTDGSIDVHNPEVDGANSLYIECNFNADKVAEAEKEEAKKKEEEKKKEEDKKEGK